MVAALAAAVPGVRIGTLVYGNTYRHPAVLANMAATADHVSDGRFVLGLGAGWQENEHEQYGIDLPPVRRARRPLRRGDPGRPRPAARADARRSRAGTTA